MPSAVANAMNGEMSVGRMIVAVNPVTNVSQTPGLVNATTVVGVTIVIPVMNTVNPVIDHLVSKVSIDKNMGIIQSSGNDTIHFLLCKRVYSQTHVFKIVFARAFSGCYSSLAMRTAHTKPFRTRIVFVWAFG